MNYKALEGKTCLWPPQYLALYFVSLQLFGKSTQYKYF